MKTPARTPLRRSELRAIWLAVVIFLFGCVFVAQKFQEWFEVPLGALTGGSENTPVVIDDGFFQSSTGADRQRGGNESRGPQVIGNPHVTASNDTRPPGDALGQLTDVGDGVLLSTAGLRYTPGSEEGHRLQHVLRHDNDIPNRPGKHGVFDGDRDTLLRVLDEAYLLIKSGDRRVQTQRQGNRTVYTVDMQRRIGFVGGQVGRASGNPTVNRVRLILEDDRVITAYPY